MPAASEESRWARFRRRRAEREALRTEEMARAEQGRSQSTPEPKEEPIATETPTTGAADSPPSRAVIDERAIRETAERDALARLERAEDTAIESTRALDEPIEPVEAGPRAALEESEVELWIERARAAVAEPLERSLTDRLAHPRAETPGAPVEDPERPPIDEPPPVESPPAPATPDRDPEPPPIDDPAPPSVEESPPPPVEEAHGDSLLAGLARAEVELESRRDDGRELARELALAESRLAESQRRTAEAIERASAQLEQVEARAREAEERAQRAERLAEIQAAESEQAARLQEMLDRIAAAEDRATSAESRVREAVSRAGDAAAGAPDVSPSAERFLAINAATLNDLLALGFSALEGGSLLEHRDRLGSFTSLDQLDAVPGVGPDRISELKQRVRL